VSHAYWAESLAQDVFERTPDIGKHGDETGLREVAMINTQGPSEDGGNKDSLETKMVHNTCYSLVSVMFPFSYSFTTTSERTLVNMPLKLKLLIEDLDLLKNDEPETKKRKQHRQNVSQTNVFLELCSNLILIRNRETQQLCGLVNQGASAQALTKLLSDNTVQLSSCLKGSKLLKVLVYGLRSRADAVGKMLLDHDCFLQQPEPLQVETVVYYNPHCFTQNDDGSTPIWDSSGNRYSNGARVVELSAKQRSKVNELLSSAVGPRVYHRVDVSDKLNTTLQE
jgi:hypothetical protein